MGSVETTGNRPTRGDDAGTAISAEPKVGAWYQVELLGLDFFDPATMENDHRPGRDLPAWFLDAVYNDLCFHVCQAFCRRRSLLHRPERKSVAQVCYWRMNKSINR